MSDQSTLVEQTVIGDHNIFSGTGDVNITYALPPAAGEDRSNLLILLNKVRHFWVESVLEQSVHHAVLLELGKETRPQEVDHPWDMDLEVPGRGKPQRLTPNTKISDIFEQTGRLLLILGEPGSGKTITLLELARDLLKKAEHDPTQPIPVVFNLSSWAEKRTPLKKWLINEFKTKYHIPNKIALTWIDNLRILPLLDGLDEVKAEHRAACLDAINKFAQEGISGIVICSRLQEYLALPRHLKLNGAICLQPLTQSQINNYLEHAGEGLETLHQLLKEDDGLRELSQTPLMLSIMVMAYYGIPTNEIQTQKIENLDMRRRQLFDLYIEKVFERKGKKNPLYPKEKIIKWLSWLAAKMKASNQSIFYMSLLQPSWLNIKEIFIYFIISRFILCFFIVFLSIFTYSLFFYLANNTFPIYKVLFSSFIFGLLLCPPIIILDIIKFYKKHDSIYKSRKLLFLFYIVSYYIIFTILFYFGEQIKFMYYIIDYLDANYGITQKYTSYSIVRIVFISIIMVSIVGATRSIIRNNIIDIYLPEQIKFSMYKSISKSILISFFFGIPLFIMIDTYMMTTQASREISMTLLLVFTIMVFIFSISVMGFNQYINNSRTKFDSEIFYAIKSIGKIYIVGMLFGGIINPLLLPFFLSSRVFDDLIILKSLYLFVIPIAIVTSTYIMTVICMFQYGGFDIINYLLLRAIIRIKINMNFKVFNYASFLTLLNPVGSGYVFIHRYLLEHFATLYEEAEQAKQKK